MSTQSQPDHDPKETTKLKLNAPRLIAGTLAAVTGAALSSRLGVAGTLVGTGFISLISGAAATVYEHSVERGRAAVRNRLSALEENGGLSRLKSTRVRSTEETGSLTHETVESGGRDARREHGRLRSSIAGLVHSPGRRWAMAGVGALATFVVALGIVTVIEVAHGSSLSGRGHQTTLGQAFSGSGHGTPQHQRRSPTPSGTPSGSTPSSSVPSSSSPSSSPSSDTPSPSDSAASSSPSATPSPTPSQESTQPSTTAPPTSAPTPAPSSPPAVPPVPSVPPSD